MAFTKEIEHIEEAISTLRLAVVDYTRKDINAQFLIDDINYSIEQLEVAKNIIKEIQPLEKPPIINKWNCIESVYISEALSNIDGAMLAYEWGKISKIDMSSRICEAIRLLSEARKIVDR